jgi:hypothetical protein
MTEQEKKDALGVITNLSAAIEKRRAADAEVGKAHKALAEVRVNVATSAETVSAALKEFGEVAMHW